MGDITVFLQGTKTEKPVWLDANTFVYTDTRDGAPQLFLRSLSGKTSEKLTENRDEISNIFFDKGSRRLYFAMDKDGNENEQIYMLELDGRKLNKLTGDDSIRNYLGAVAGNEIFFSANQNQRNLFDLCRRKTDGGSIQVLVQGKNSIVQPCAVSGDQHYLVYSSRSSFKNSRLIVMDLHTGMCRPVSKAKGEVFEESPVFGEQGFYYLSDEDCEFKRVWYAKPEEGSCVVAAEYSWDVTGIALSEDGKYLAVCVNEDGDSRLYIRDLHTGEEEPVGNLPMGIIEGPCAWSPKGHKLLFPFECGTRKRNLWMYDADTKNLEELFSQNKQEESSLVEPILLHYESFDQRRIPFLLYVPKGMERKKLPIAVYIHGGPESQMRRTYEEGIQYVVSQGIAVAAPNVRGSTGYGKTYVDLDNREKRLDAVKDIEYLVKYLVRENIGDKDRIGVWGRSYGGFMTLSCAARLPGLWACAVDIVGMFNLVTFLKHTAGYRRLVREAEYGSLATDHELLYEVSPCAVMEQLECPLLVIHGANDTRVPVSEAEEAVKTLKSLGRRAEYFCFEDEGHILIKEENKQLCARLTGEFLRKHLLQS